MSRDRTRPLVLRGATIVTMDDAIGDFTCADLLVEGDQIAAIAPVIPMQDAEVNDMRGRILIPGLVNAHMHTWQTGLRGLAADWTLPQYLRLMHAGLAQRFTQRFVGCGNTPFPPDLLFRLALKHLAIKIERLMIKRLGQGGGW